MTGRRGGPQRVRKSHIEGMSEALSARDWAILRTLDQVRLASGGQLERLHFHNLAGRSRAVVRGRVLKRLTDDRVLLPYERRIGTANRGSAELAYVLDSAGQRLARLRTNREDPEQPARRPRRPGERFVAHSLAVTELYVALVERRRIGSFRLEAFEVEPAWPNGLGGWVKPDAYLKLRNGDVADYWWYEADLATESLPTISRKLRVYVDFVTRGQLGPEDVMPRVVVGVPTDKRQWAVQREVSHLPDPADMMFRVTKLQDVADLLMQELIN
jgi:hypothetical protein